MTNPSDEEWDEIEWQRSIDNLIILMCLTLARVTMREWKGDDAIVGRVRARVDQLIEQYKDPNA